jgi:anti-anti-sigma regulatory factor
MLRITTHHDCDTLTFQLEGRLAGPWVQELLDCWERTPADSRRAVGIDLTGVTYVDAAGKELLSILHAQGIQLVAAGCLMRAIVAEIAHRTSQDREDNHERADEDRR